MFTHRLAVVALLCLLVLTACSAVTTSPVPTSPVIQPPGPKRITFWHSWSGPSSRILAELALQYQADHPDVTIQLEERPVAFLRRDYRQAVLSGGAPDLVLLSSNRWIGNLADEKLLLPLEADSLLAEDGTEHIEQQFYSSALDGSRYAGHLYGLPLSVNLPVLFYNRANFHAGPPEDTVQWLQLARVGRDRSSQRWGLAYNLTLDFTLPYLSAFGGAILDNQGKLVLGESGSEGAEQWLSWLHDLHRQSRNGDLLAVEDHQVIDQAVQSGRARLMVVDWSSRLPLYRSIWGADVDVAPLPPLARPGNDKPVPAVPHVHSEVLAINPRTAPEERQLAIDFMRWLTSLEAQRRLLEIPDTCPSCPFKQPVRRDINLEQFPLSAKLAQIVQSSQPSSSLPAMEICWPYIQDMVRAVLSDRLVAEEAVSQTASQLCTILQQQECQK